MTLPGLFVNHLALFFLTTVNIKQILIFLRYPNGSARVTFATSTAFRRAVLAEYVHVVTPRFSKTIQLDAYIEDGTCSICRNTTPVFCRHPDCFR